MEEAIMAQGFSNLDAIVPGAGNQMREYLERIALKKKRREAARVKPEDIQTMGLTYAWRNAEVNKDGQIALQVVETAAAIVVNIVPGVGQAASMAMMAYMAAKQAYMGSLHGGTKGALAGALSGAAAGALSMSGSPINFNVSYDFDDGWGGSIGANLPIGNTGFTGGMSLNFQEGEGYTGSGINLGYKATGSNSDSAGIFGSGDYGYGGNLGLQFDRYGNFAGGSVTGNYSSTDYGFNNGTGTFSGGIRLNADGHYAGVDVNYTNSVDGPAFAGKKTSYLVGGGLSLNKDGSYGLNTTIGTTLSDDYRMGFYGGGATQNSKLMWDKDGKYIGGNQSIDLQVQMQTRNQALTKVLTDINSGKLSMEEVESLQNQLNTLAGRDQANMWLDKNRNALKLAYNGISDEEADQILNGTHPTIKLEDALHKTAAFMKKLNPSMKTGKSPDGILDTITGAIGDFGNFLFMNKYSDDLGYIDPSNGEWVPNTCFVKGTLVAVAPYTNGAFEKNGKYYKEIQDIRQGDSVSAWDEVSGGLTYSKVLHTFIRKSGSVFRIHLENGKTLDTTWSHPFYVADIGWVKATNLHPGMWLPTRSGIVHYNESLALSGGHGLPLQAVSFGSISGRNTGTVLLRSNMTGAVRIVGVEEIPVGETVYNFSVAENHNYFVGEQSVLVHNESNYLATIRENFRANKQMLVSLGDFITGGRVSRFLCGAHPACSWEAEKVERFFRVKDSFTDKYGAGIAYLGARCGISLGLLCDDPRTLLTEQGFITPDTSEEDALAYVEAFDEIYSTAALGISFVSARNGGSKLNLKLPELKIPGLKGEPVPAGGPRFGPVVEAPPAKGGPTSLAEGRPGSYTPPPKEVPAFPELQRVKPKTPVQGGGGLRARWKDSKGNIYEWDSRHGTLEKYDKGGKHLGEFDPKTGKELKPRNPEYEVDP